MRKGINVQAKFWLTMAAVLVLVVGMTSWVYSEVKKEIFVNEADDQLHHLDLEKDEILNLMAGMKEDVRILSKLSSLNKLIGEGEGQAQVVDDFVNFVKVREFYYQVRYLDEKGDEVVRVDNVNGEIVVLEQSKLQNKSERYYFLETMNLESGQVYISPMDLNRENGELENRGTLSKPEYVPTLRYAIPVLDEDGEKKGIVIVNVYGEYVLAMQKKNNEFFLDQDGYYLKHVDKNKMWGRELATGENAYQDIPGLEDAMSEASVGIFEDEKENELVAYTKIELGEYDWVLMRIVDGGGVLGIKLDVARWMGMVVVGLLPIMIIYYWLLVRGVLAPLSKLKKEVEHYDDNERGGLLEIDSKDEIGELAGAFNEMIEKMSGLRKELEETVVERTAELEKIKIKLEKQQSALLNVLEDVNEEKEYESSRSKSLLETVNEGIVVVDEVGVVEYVNPALERLLGFPEEKLRGKILADTLKAYDLKGRELSPENLSSSAMVTQDQGELKIQIENKDGEKVAVSISAAPIYQAEKFRGIVMVLHDFSADLRLTQQKDDFFSIASHELRTPLTVISGNLDMLAGGVGGSELTEEDKEMLGDTLEASDRLTRMVSDFLNVSRIDQGRLQVHVDKVPMYDLIGKIVKEYGGIAKEKEIELVASCSKKGSVMVKGDEDKLREVIINLVGNSLKFTKKGKIKIEGEVKGDQLEVRVVDTGMGIDKDKQELLFQRFQQAMSRTLAREAGGTGLGLYISREFMRLMDGDLRLVKSVKGKGSTFAFTIPLAGKQGKKKKKA